MCLVRSNRETQDFENVEASSFSDIAFQIFLFYSVTKGYDMNFKNSIYLTYQYLSVCLELLQSQLQNSISWYERAIN